MAADVWKPGPVEVLYCCRMCGKEERVVGNNMPAPTCCTFSMVAKSVTTILPETTAFGEREGVQRGVAAVVPSKATVGGQAC